MTRKNVFKLKLPNIDCKQPHNNALVWTQNICSVFMCRCKAFVPFSFSKLHFQIYLAKCGGGLSRVNSGLANYLTVVNFN